MSLSKQLSKPLSRRLAKIIAGGAGSLFDIYSKYYQFIFTDRQDDIIDKAGTDYYQNFGTGGEDVDVEIISGTMAGLDLIIQQPTGDFGLFTLSKAYPALDIFYGATENDPLQVTYTQLKNIDLTGIPPEDFYIDNTGVELKNMALAPYEFEPLMDVTGSILFDDNGEMLYALKKFN